MTEYFYSHYGAPNASPYFADTEPNGPVSYDTPVSFKIYDDGGAVVLSSIQLTLEYDDGGPIFLDVIVDGVVQSGYTGTLTPNLLNGYDVEVTADGVAGWGQWDYDVTAEAQDAVGATGTTNWTFESTLIAAIVGTRAIGRSKIEIELDRAVAIRPVSIKAEAPSDRYTPVVWSGSSTDAANPGNYTLARKTDGNLSGAGEAADIAATWAEENPDHSSVSAGYVWSTHVWVYTDYQMTARADYVATIENLVISTEPMPATDRDFVGYVVSQVPRASLKFVESVPALIMAEDDEGTGDLRTFLEVLQETFDRVVEDIDAFFLELCTIDRTRDEFIDGLLWDLGDPFSGLLDLTASQKRKLAGVLVQMYREKGTCDGIVNAVRFFLGVTLSGCREPWADAWRLDGGSYGSYTGPDLDELGETTSLAPSEGSYRYTFWLISPVTLTAEQRYRIGLIAEYVKPAYTLYQGILEP